MLRELTYPSQPGILADLRRQVAEVAEFAGLSPEEVHDVMLAVNEAVANIIEHAYRWREDGEIRVRLIGRKGEVEVRLRDFGRKVDITQLRSRDLDDLRDGGIGLYLMRTLMDEVVYDTSHDVGTELIMVKRHREPDERRSLEPQCGMQAR